MLPSGAIEGEEDDWSMTRPAGLSFVAGSTPVVAPSAQPPGVPFGGSNTLQPSLRKSRSEVCHCGRRSAVTATMYE